MLCCGSSKSPLASVNRRGSLLPLYSESVLEIISDFVPLAFASTGNTIADSEICGIQQNRQ